MVSSYAMASCEPGRFAPGMFWSLHAAGAVSLCVRRKVSIAPPQAASALSV
jgi:hypothetical protein